MRLILLCAGFALVNGVAMAQVGMTGHATHSRTGHDMSGAPSAANAIATPSEPGQSAFAAIQEIVAILVSDPATDWSKVDVEALRQHLIDMDNVTLRAQVAMSETEHGVSFEVTSDEASVIDSIRRMVVAHAATMSGANGWEMIAEEIPRGVNMTVAGPDADRIRALGFIGLMTLGMHHQSHHLTLARGRNPHQH